MEKMNTQKWRRLGLALALGATPFVTQAQQKIGGAAGAADPNAYLQLGDVTGANKGLLLSRVALTATSAASPLTAHVAGMTVYNTATAGSGNTAVTPGYYYNDGSKWVRIAANSDIAAMAWVPNGNTNGALKTIGTNDNFDLPFVTNNSEKMRLNTGGYLGIGTTAPGSILDITNDNRGNNYDDVHIRSYNNNGGNAPGLYFNTTRGTVVAPANLQKGDYLGTLSLNGRANNGDQTFSGIDARYQGNGITNLSDLAFGTSGSPRMYIDTIGNVGIGTSTPTAPLTFKGNGRKISLYAAAANDNQYNGFGLGGGQLISQVNDATNNFSWRAGTSDTTSNYLMTLTGGGKLGLGTTAPGNMLTVNGGKIQYTDGTQGNGKVLVSDANGVASWQPEGSYWGLTGNTGTTAPTVIGTAAGTANFWGTSDAKNLAVGTNGITRMIFDQNGNAYGGNGVKVPAGSNGFVWGQNNIDSSSYTLIGGQNNTIGSGSDGADVLGVSNRISNSTSTFASGWNHTVTNSANATVGGSSNTLYNAGSSAVLGSGNIDSSRYNIMSGYNDTIGAGSDGAAVLGVYNRLTNSTGAIVSGAQNKVSNSAYPAVSGMGNIVNDAGSSAVSGLQNTVANNCVAAIVGGAYNQVYDSRTSIVGGKSNIDSAAFCIMGGQNNVMGAGSYNSAVLGGSNRISGSPSTFVSGINHTVSNSANAFVSGSGNNVTNGNASAVLGDGNTATGNGNPFGIIAGQANIIYGANQAAVFGYGNIDSASYTLVNGKVNKTSASNSGLVNGENNQLLSTYTGYYTYNGTALGKGLPGGVTIFGGRNFVSGVNNNVGAADGSTPGTGANGVIGNDNTVSQVSSSLIAGQQDTITNARFITALGFGQTISNSNGAVAAGGTNTIQSSNLAVALGSNNQVNNAVFGVAIGQGNTVNNNNSMALGTNATTTASNQLVLGFSGGVLFSGTQSIVLPKATAAPASPVEGQSYYDTTIHKLRVFDGTTWQNAW